VVTVVQGLAGQALVDRAGRLVDVAGPVVISGLDLDFVVVGFDAFGLVDAQGLDGTRFSGARRTAG